MPDLAPLSSAASCPPTARSGSRCGTATTRSTAAPTPPPCPPPVTECTWARFLEPSEPVHALVAERGGQLVGLAHYLFHRSTIHIEPVCYLQDLFTGPQARAQGVGRALIEAVAARARAAGASRLYWLTHESNATARRLYDRVAQHSGFIVYRRPL